MFPEKVKIPFQLKHVVAEAKAACFTRGDQFILNMWSLKLELCKKHNLSMRSLKPKLHASLVATYSAENEVGATDA